MQVRRLSRRVVPDSQGAPHDDSVTIALELGIHPRKAARVPRNRAEGIRMGRAGRLLARGVRANESRVSPERVAARQIGAYLMFDQIARGGMSSVHIGRSTGPGDPRLVAIKLLDPEALWQPAAITMFIDEARLGAYVRHPNVGHTRELVVDPAEGAMALVLEYIHGATLATLVRLGLRQGRQLGVALAAGITVGVLRGLQAVHDATTADGTPLGIVHRDVSPQNVMIGVDGQVRLIDFGIASSLLQQGSRDEGRLRGKARYMAPEQIRGEAVDHRADVFAAGVVLWQLLTGKRLFEGHGPRAIWWKILQWQPAPPSHLNPSVPPALDGAVLRALERNPDRRFPTAAAFADAIAQTTDLAGPATIAGWARDTAGDLFERRARRGREILDASTRRSRVRHAARHRQLIRRLSTSWRLRALAPLFLLLAVAIVGVSRSGGTRERPAAVAHDVSRADAPIDPPPAPQGPEVSVPLIEQIAPRPPSAPLGTDDECPLPDACFEPPPTPVAEVRLLRERRPGSSESPGSAPGASPLAQITKLNRRADRAYRLGEFTRARKLLRSALATAAVSKLSESPQTALAHAQLAMVLIKGFGKRERAVKECRKALLVRQFSPPPSLFEDPQVISVYRQAVVSLEPTP